MENKVILTSAILFLTVAFSDRILPAKSAYLVSGFAITIEYVLCWFLLDEELNSQEKTLPPQLQRIPRRRAQTARRIAAENQAAAYEEFVTDLHIMRLQLLSRIWTVSDAILGDLR